MRLICDVLGLVVVGFGICVGFGASEGRLMVADEMVGSTPCDAELQKFVGGIPLGTPVHCITWNFSLVPTNSNRQAGTFKLVATYELPGRNDPNQMERGPTVELQGNWMVVKGARIDPESARVYQVFRANGEKPIEFVRVSEHLWHFLDEDKKLKVGNAGWSYTLNRKGLGHEN